MPEQMLLLLSRYFNDMSKMFLGTNEAEYGQFLIWISGRE